MHTSGVFLSLNCVLTSQTSKQRCMYSDVPVKKTERLLSGRSDS